MTTAQEPIISTVYDKQPDGTYRATMQVSGLATEAQAQAAIEHMWRLFCGEEIEMKQ